MANDWMKGTGTNALVGGDNANTIDNGIKDYIEEPLSRLLYTYRKGCIGFNASGSGFSVSAGEVVCRNGLEGTQLRFRRNTLVLSVGTGNLDIGSVFSNSTLYSYYAVADVVSDATFTIKVTLKTNSGPSGATYYRKLGDFFVNGSGTIELGGIIKMFSGPVTMIPEGHYLCDGANGTPDLRDRFILGAGNLANPGHKGGNNLNSSGDNIYSVTNPSGQSGALQSGPNPTVDSNHTHLYMPRYYALAFIMEAGVF